MNLTIKEIISLILISIPFISFYLLLWIGSIIYIKYEDDYTMLILTIFLTFILFGLIILII